MDEYEYLKIVKENVTKQKEIINKALETTERMKPKPEKQNMDECLVEIEKHLRDIAGKLNENIDLNNITVDNNEKAEKINDFILGKTKDMSLFTIEELRVMNVIKRNI